MTDFEKKSIIQRANAIGVNVSLLEARGLKIVRTILDYVDGQVLKYHVLKDEIKSFDSHFTTTAIANATDLSRSNLSRNPVFRELISAAHPDLGTEILVPRNEYERMKAEIAMNAEWHNATVLKELDAANMEEEIERLKRLLETEKAARAQQSIVVATLKKENMSLRAQLEEANTTFIKTDNDEIGE